MELFWIDEGHPFPSSENTQPNGLLCAGGNLEPATLITAYSHGIFPWYSADEPILWWSPDPRMVLFPGEFKTSHSLQRTIRQQRFEIRIDSAFADVITACAAPRTPEGGTWIVPEMVQAYTHLHQLGIAHSVESWIVDKAGDKMVGGLYGVALGRVFYGESMFSRVTDASKVALVALVKKLQADGFELIDCQQQTQHLASFGARPIPRREFTQRLQELIISNPATVPLSAWRPAQS